MFLALKCMMYRCQMIADSFVLDPVQLMMEMGMVNCMVQWWKNCNLNQESAKHKKINCWKNKKVKKHCWLISLLILKFIEDVITAVSVTFQQSNDFNVQIENIRNKKF